MHTEYHLLVFLDFKSIEEAVNSMLKAGYQCQGGIVITEIKGTTTFIQAVVK